MVKYPASIVVLCVFFSYSCSFQPEGENIIPVSNLPQVRVLEMDLLNTSDTFPIFSRTTNLNFDIDVENHDTIWVDVYIDGIKEETYRSSKGNIVINASDFEEGYHTIQLDVVTNSGTGSLLDKLGAELLLWSKQWIFFLKFEPAETLEILEVSPKDGRLFIKWEEGSIFTEKKLSFYSEGRSWEHIIPDPTMTSWIDEVYVGGNIRITLENISLNPDYRSGITTYNTEFPAPVITSFSSNEFGHLKLAWDLPLFYKNLQQIEFNYNGNVIHYTTSQLDTFAIVKDLPFAGSLPIVVRAISKYDDFDFGDRLKTRTVSYVYIGEKRNVFLGRIFYSSINKKNGFQSRRDHIAVLYGDSVIVEVENEGYLFKESVSITPNGDYLYFDDDYVIRRIDRNGKIEDVIHSNEIFGEDKWFKTFSTDGERYICFTHSSYAENLYMYDLMNRELVFDLQIPGFYSRDFYTEQTSDGRYLIVQDYRNTHLLSLEDGLIQDTLTFSSSDFFLDKGRNLLITSRWSSGEISVYDLTTKTGKSSTSEIAGLDQSNVSYDFVTGYIGGRKEGLYYVINPADGKIVRQIHIENYSNPYSLYDGNLYYLNQKMDLRLK